MTAPTAPADTEIRHIVQMQDCGAQAWHFHCTAPRMTAEQAVDLAADWNVKRARGGSFRAVRITTTREILG